MESNTNESAMNQNEEIVSENAEAPENVAATGATENTAPEQSVIQKTQAELAEQKDKYLRLYSEFDNFRRRTAKEKLDLIQSANEQLLKSLLPVVDDFDRATKAFKDNATPEAEGFLLIYNKLKKTLDQAGVKIMDVGAGSDFNADLHEAITQIPAPTEKLKGKVVDVIENGYLLNDKVIRFAKVVVGA